MISAVFKGFKKKERGRIGGNAMVYVLVAIALFGVLTATLSSQNSQSDGQDIDDELVEFYATELMEYAAAAKNVVDQMIMTGTTIDQLNFVNPTSRAFNTAPHIHKVYHPQGGGLNYQNPSYPPFQETTFTYTHEWYTGKINVEWTLSTQTDAILSAYGVEEKVCNKINEILTGSPTLPSVADMANHFVIFTNDFTSTECATCVGYTNLCVQNSFSDRWTFYTILAAQ